MWNKESGSIWESRKNDMDVLIGSDKDLSLGKSSSGGSGGSDSSSSGGGSGGYTNGYAATATGMAEYAYSRIGDHISTFYDDPIIKGSSDGKGGYQWCEPFIQYCAKKVGYKPSGGVSNLTKSSRGSIIFQASFIPKGYTYYIYLTADGVSGGHWGIAWSKTSTQIKAIEANTSYRGTNRSRAKDVTKVQMVQYNYNGMGKYVRDDNYTDYIKLYCINK